MRPAGGRFGKQVRAASSARRERGEGMKRHIAWPLAAIGCLVGGEFLLAASTTTTKVTLQEASLLDPFAATTTTALSTSSSTTASAPITNTQDPDFVPPGQSKKS